MNRLCLILLFLIADVPAIPQSYRLPAGQLEADSIRLAELPKLVLKKPLKSGYLPYQVDNSKSWYFPPLFTQFGYSCNQCSSIAYLFTYETNIIRKKSPTTEDNRYSLLFPWNMLNSGKANVGVSYFDSWDVVKDAGCPSVADFGYGTGRDPSDCTIWMSGYQKYYHAMQNRIEGIWSIDIGTPEGLQTLKSWLFDHGGEESPGGVASFQIASAAYQLVTLPAGTEEEGKILIGRFRSEVGHSMTFVGYNDSVRYDFNGDGKYTNDLDTNGDGKVTMLDWEKGALIFVDSYAGLWGNTGKAFVAYRVLPNNHLNGGIWMRSAVVARVKESYKPLLGLRVKLSCEDRSKLRITVGVSQNPGASKPEHLLDLPVFNYRGGDFPMQGLGSGDRNKIEIGIDATPLLDFVEPGRSASFFLVIDEKDPDGVLPGLIEHFAFIDYSSGGEEHTSGLYNSPLMNGYHYYKVNFAPDHHPPAVATPSLSGIAIGEPIQLQMTATGGVPPYKWLPVKRIYSEEIFADTFPAITERRILPVVGNDVKMPVNLPFSFPLYDRRFSRMTVYTDGALMFENSTYTYPYAIDRMKLVANNRAIYPWYNTDLVLPHMQDWIWYQADSSRATVRWNASIISGGKFCDVNFAARLYPSGMIEFYYGNIEMRPFFNWFAAIAGGNADQFVYPEVNQTGVSNGLNIRFIPTDFPDGIALSPDGILSGTLTEPGKSWTFPVWVEDSKGLRGSRDFTLSTASLGTPVADLDNPSVMVYPNPVADKLTISIRKSGGGNVLLRVLDLTGKELIHREYEVLSGDVVLDCGEVSRLPEGIYLYSVTGAAAGSGRLIRL